MNIYTGFEERNYFGDRYIVNGDVLSKYARRKLATASNNWGFVRFVGSKLDKFIIDVYYLDFDYPNSPINYISREVVDKKDVILLNWDIVRSMFNMGVTHIVANYLEYIELFKIIYTKSDVDSDWVICEYKPIKDFEYKPLKFYTSYFECYSEGQKWMFEQIEQGKINLNEHLKNIKKKYYNC